MVLGCAQQVSMPQGSPSMPQQAYPQQAYPQQAYPQQAYPQPMVLSSHSSQGPVPMTSMQVYYSMMPPSQPGTVRYAAQTIHCVCVCSSLCGPGTSAASTPCSLFNCETPAHIHLQR